MNQSEAQQTLQIELNDMLALVWNLKEVLDPQGESEAIAQRHRRHRRRDMVEGRGHGT